MTEEELKESIKDHRHLLAAILHKLGGHIELSDREMLFYNRNLEGKQWTLVISHSNLDRVTKVAVAEIQEVLNNE